MPRCYGARVTYDPRRLQGVTVYRETDRAFATGDRVQFTAPDRERQIANRELGTIEKMDARGLNPASSVEQIDRSVARNHQAQQTIAQGLER